MGARRLNSRRRGDFLESGKTLNDLGRIGAIIRDHKHICAPPTP
jgi:hypothetical protein